MHYLLFKANKMEMPLCNRHNSLINTDLHSIGSYRRWIRFPFLQFFNSYKVVVYFDVKLKKDEGGRRKGGQRRIPKNI